MGTKEKRKQWMETEEKCKQNWVSLKNSVPYWYHEFFFYLEYWKTKKKVKSLELFACNMSVWSDNFCLFIIKKRPIVPINPIIAYQSSCNDDVYGIAIEWTARFMVISTVNKIDRFRTFGRCLFNLLLLLLFPLRSLCVACELC